MALEEVIIAAASCVIALIALVVAIWQGVVMRRHNRMTVTPHLRIDSRLGAVPIVISLSNRGVGPAVVTEVSIYAHEAAIGHAMEQLNSALKFAGASGIKCACLLPRVGEFIAVGETVDLLVYPECTDDELRRLNEALPRVNFRVRYASIYGDKHELTYAPKASPALALQTPRQKPQPNTEPGSGKATRSGGTDRKSRGA